MECFNMQTHYRFVASLCISSNIMFVQVSSSITIGDYTQQEDSAWFNLNTYFHLMPLI